jgi:hypothetical protein
MPEPVTFSFLEKNHRVVLLVQSVHSNQVFMAIIPTG